MKSMQLLRVFVPSCLIALFAACDGVGADDDGGTDGGVLPGNITFCDVKTLLDAQCGSCHGTTPVRGAPPLTTRAQLMAQASVGGTLLDRSIYLMGFTPVSGAMPPNVGSPLSDIHILEAWKKNGTPNCLQADGGVVMPVDAGVQGPVCTSGQTWRFGTSGREEMNPGEACVSCHTSRRRGPIYGFMGTVYPTLHETPLCLTTVIPTGLTVEILDMAGNVALTMSPSVSTNGNFVGGTVGVPSPYRARVSINGVVKSEMLTNQTNGDCNSCHTSTGTQNAPGRIHW